MTESPVQFAVAQLPASKLAERSVLGACLMADCVGELEPLLRPEDFYLASHRRIYRAMLGLAKVGKPIDFITLGEALERSGDLDAVGGHAYLISLTDGLPRSVNVEHYAAIVKDRARRRRMLDLARRLAVDAVDDSADPEAIVVATDRDLLALAADDARETAVHVREIAPKVLDQAASLVHGDRAPAGLTTSIPDLDAMTGGLQPGELVIVGGWTGTGKSSIGVGVVAENALRGVPCAYFTPEMQKAEVVRRMIARVARMSYYRIRMGFLGHADLDRMTMAAAQVADWPLWIDDTSSLSIGDLVARARVLVRQHDVRMFVVDYLQLLAGRSKERRIAVTEVSNGLRDLAKSEGVAVVALSQLGRPVTKERFPRPNRFHLKESGDIENDAHLILLIYRQEDGTDIIVDKQRSGPTGDVPVYYDGDSMSYYPAAQPGESAGAA